MAKYDTPSGIRPLEKLIVDFSYQNGFDAMNVFNDFLTYIIHGFSPEAPPLHNWKYKKQHNRVFMEMVIQWIQIMNSRIKEDTDWYDPFGDLYMALVSNSTQQYQGQFFTPVHICDLMVMCTCMEEKKTGQRMGDPTCGSGRLLLAYHVRNLGNYLVGEDINRTCCLMTVCNMLIHGCVGEVICHDSLNPKNFVDGWKVNPDLTYTGIPTIKKMSLEEYQATRNLPSSPYTIQKASSVNNRKRHTHNSFPVQATLNM